ncbi:hypothetical protein GEV27_13980 [Aeromicrobium sp. S22]|uniref:hypothetical protein n=1 Tax=Aeromicrobium sp. S22 TaxID=2662029 RepID=UPI00129E4401|nr:hypothetical protein [Aeromicrobium sp. S22]MRK02625.1 hypothetical protein [Aeromicrobium sp. S22]
MQAIVSALALAFWGFMSVNATASAFAGDYQLPVMVLALVVVALAVMNPSDRPIAVWFKRRPALIWIAVLVVVALLGFVLR